MSSAIISASKGAVPMLGVLVGVWMAGAAAAQEQSAPVAELRQLQARVRRVVRDAGPSVVSISDGRGAGSGVIVDEDGLILTAGHVVLGADPRRLQVVLSDGRTVPAEVVGMHLTVDAAMVRIRSEDPQKWPARPLGDSTSLRAGQWCVAMGHPGGFEPTRTAPVRLGRVLARGGAMLVTDCIVVGGDSGGPLFDLDGKVIGIHSSIGPSVAENRHVPIARFQDGWERMLRGDRWGRLAGVPGRQLNRPVLGVKLIPEAERAEIGEVTPGGPAESAGIRAGDVVTSIDGKAVNDSIDVSIAVGRRRPGERIEVKIERAGAERSFSVRLARRR